jgi:hypothetical protein
MSARAVIQLLKENAAITALVGNSIHANIIKQGATYPAIYVSTDRMNPLNCMVSSGIRTGMIELGVYATTYEKAQEVMQATRTLLDDYEGTVSGVGVAIQRGTQTADQYDPEGGHHVLMIEYDAITQG